MVAHLHATNIIFQVKAEEAFTETSKERKLREKLETSIKVPYSSLSSTINLISRSILYVFVC